MKTTQIYKSIHKAHAARFLVVASMMSCVIVCALIAIFYGKTMPAIWLMLAFQFLLFIGMVEYHACNDAYEKYLLAKADESTKTNYKN